MTDPIHTLQTWVCFRDGEEDDSDTLDEDTLDEDTLDEDTLDEDTDADVWLPIPPPPQMPYFRETPKTGRNDPCQCGSGKKYKKCCMPV